MNVITIIVTYNPDLKRFSQGFSSALMETDHVIVVDYNSQNKDLIKALCSSATNCEFIEMFFNSGIAHALRVGINYARKYEAKWFLFLDDDTILLKGSMAKALEIVDKLPEIIKQRIGTILLGSEEGYCNIKEIRYGIFSGTLIKGELVSKVCCRDEFFLDSADHDMYSRVRELGYLTLTIYCKLVNHRLGKMMWIPVASSILRKPTYYEPPWRYYYIVRNSTKLLIEGRIDFLFYLHQITDWGIKIIFVDGFKKFLRSLGLGLIHAFLDKFSYLDRFKVRVLKMDCKGCEYDVINEVDVLRLFDIVKIEYSGYLRGKTYHELKSTLEKLGFTCRVWAHNENALRIGLDRHGMLTCVKNREGLIR